MKKSTPVAATPAAAPQPRRSSAKAKPTRPRAAAAAPGNNEDRDDTIRRIAYGFYEARGYVDGHAIDD